MVVGWKNSNRRVVFPIDKNGDIPAMLPEDMFFVLVFAEVRSEISPGAVEETWKEKPGSFDARCGMLVSMMHLNQCHIHPHTILGCIGWLDDFVCQFCLFLVNGLVVYLSMSPTIPFTGKSQERKHE